MIYGKSLARAGQSGSLASCPAALRPRTWARVVRRYATARYDPNKSRLSQPLRLFSRLLALQWDKKLTLLARNSPSRGKLEEKQAQPTAGTESKSNAALFYVDKTGVPGRRASARKRTLDRVTATDREPVAQRKSKEPRISERIKKIYKTRSKKRRKRQQRKQQARAGGAAATAVAAAESTDALAPSREESQTDDMLWCGPGDKAAAPRVGPKRRAPKPVVPDARLAESRYNRPLEAQSYNPEPQAQRDLIRQAGAVLQAEAEERARIRACIEPIPEPAPPRRGRRRADQDEYVVEDEEVPAEVVNSVVRAENRLTKRQRRRRKRRVKMLKSSADARSLSVLTSRRYIASSLWCAVLAAGIGSKKPSAWRPRRNGQRMHSTRVKVDLAKSSTNHRFQKCC